MNDSEVHRTSDWSNRFLGTWADVIGPEYARDLLPARRTLLVAIILVGGGIALILIWSAVAGTWAPAPLVFIGDAIGFAPALFALVVAIARLMGLSARVKRDLGAAGFPEPKAGPDFRGVSWFMIWAKRFDVSLDSVKAAGRWAESHRLDAKI